MYPLHSGGGAMYPLYSGGGACTLCTQGEGPYTLCTQGEGPCTLCTRGEGPCTEDQNQESGQEVGDVAARHQSRSIIVLYLAHFYYVGYSMLFVC